MRGQSLQAVSRPVQRRIGPPLPIWLIPIEICLQRDQNGACTDQITTLSSLISRFNHLNGSWWGIDNVAFRFGPLTNNRGTFYLYDKATMQQQTPQLIAASTSELKTVNGVQLLMADGRPIFAVYNGKVFGGWHYPANVASLSSEYNFNKTAVNAIFTAAGWPVIP